MSQAILIFPAVSSLTVSRPFCLFFGVLCQWILPAGVPYFWKAFPERSSVVSSSSAQCGQQADTQIIKVLPVLYFSNPTEKSARRLTKLSRISVALFFSLVNCLTHLLQEQYPADKFVLFELSVSPPSRCLLCQYQAVLELSLVPRVKVILAEHFEASVSVPAGLAAEPGYRLGA